MPYIHKFILYKSNRTIMMSYRKFPDKGDNPNKYIFFSLVLYLYFWWLTIWYSPHMKGMTVLIIPKLLSEGHVNTFRFPSPSIAIWFHYSILVHLNFFKDLLILAKCFDIKFHFLYKYFTLREQKILELGINLIKVHIFGITNC